ncbi:MAG TPA: sulfite exporter TauE/SafE family protein [Methylomirabilota bacterium]
MTSVDALIFASIVVFLGYVVFGVTGFGASPITVPLLAHVLPLTFVLSLAAMLDLASGLALGIHTRRQANREELLVLIPFTLLGLVLGVTLLVNLPRAVTLRALGVFVCVYAVYATMRRDTRHRLARAWAAPAGVAGGALGALFGTGGPPYVMYLTGRVADPASQRATISQMVILNVGLRVIAFALAGLLFTRELWGSVAVLLPVAWAAVWVGNTLQAKLPSTMLARIIAAALCVTGVSLIVRTL